ncbi:TRAPP trafficking subunit Trs65-domain-containing protein [Mycotypha africana]|uniref:TRAPP trafficking subunit Trs65-domain-containing protein n=1 Tax=Mycotypha africana TaxID=64632 RepID=UPI0022FFE4BA|nr:TRAPP trafficking subunit Trs65-domain-containing protein [Mycotypha africana]KAI8987985.1 TRAPP trafficking subunit Trs65-domain-containing protein [Mycotypha africana]
MGSVSTELFFNEADFRIIIPNLTTDEKEQIESAAILEAQPRQFAFYDEHLQVYLLACLSQQITGTGDEVKEAVHSFYSQLDVTVDATFVDNVPNLQSTGLYRSNSVPTQSPNIGSASPKISASQPHYQHQRRSVLNDVSTPFFTQAHNRNSKDSMILFENDNNYCCLYRMLIPIVYAKAKSTNPSLSINYTLQYRPQSTKRASCLMDNKTTDDSEYDTNLFETINLLSGLEDDPVFSNQNYPLQRFVIDGQQRPLSADSSWASVQNSNLNANSPTATNQLSLKRNIRENLPIRSGLVVKMRTTNAAVTDKMVMMSVELENPADIGCEFLIDEVDVQISNAVVTTAFQQTEEQSKFPIFLNKSDLMVFVYNITLLEDGSVKPPTQQRIFPSRRSYQQQQQQPQQLPNDEKPRPQRVSIQVVACPIIDGKKALPMRSKWNTMLDVSGRHFHQQQRRDLDPLQETKSSNLTRSQDLNSVSSTSPAIYSPGARSIVGSPVGLGNQHMGASLETVFGSRNPLPNQQPIGVIPGSPASVSNNSDTQLMRERADGIVVSFTVPDSIRVGKTFPLHIFIVNRSKHTRRFQIVIPNRKRQPANIQGHIMKSTLPPLPLEKLPIDPYMSESGFLKQYFENETHEADIICLENNVRLSPLGPSTSQSVDIQFIAVKDKLHTIDLIQLVDLDTGFVTNLRQVLEVYVEP